MKVPHWHITPLEYHEWFPLSNSKYLRRINFPIKMQNNQSPYISVKDNTHQREQYFSNRISYD